MQENTKQQKKCVKRTKKIRTKGVSCGTLREKLKLAGFFEERRYKITPKQPDPTYTNAREKTEKHPKHNGA